MQHTPGPWTVADDGTIEAKFLGRVGQLVGCCDADARLIAAAPDLLAALRGVVMCADARGLSETEDAYQTRRAMLPQQIARARAAIAQATGDAR